MNISRGKIQAKKTPTFTGKLWQNNSVEHEPSSVCIKMTTVLHFFLEDKFVEKYRVLNQNEIKMLTKNS